MSAADAYDVDGLHIVINEPRAADARWDPGVLPAPQDPYSVASVLAEAAHMIDGQLVLRHWRGTYIRWGGTAWAEISDRAVRRWLYLVLSKAWYEVVTTDKSGGVTSDMHRWIPNRRNITDVMDALQSKVFLEDDQEAADWIEPATGPAPSELVPLRNGILHVVGRTLLPRTPTLLNLSSADVDYSREAPEPVEWLRFLSDQWPEDPASIELLREWFGYVLSGQTDLQKIMLMTGPPRSGKGTITRILGALLGRRNMISPTLSSLATDFGLSLLIGKPLAVIADARMAAGPGTQVIVERLLTISGEDVLSIDRKYRDFWTGQLPTRLMIVSNEGLKLGDASGAVVTRLLSLTTTRSHLGHEDHRLFGRLAVELPGILLWALTGLERLRAADHFTQPESGLGMLEAMRSFAAPVGEFIAERCVRHPAAEVPVAVLFAAWQDWSAENGREHSGTIQSFGRDLLAAVPGARVVKHRASDHKLYRWYAGLKLDA